MGNLHLGGSATQPPGSQTTQFGLDAVGCQDRVNLQFRLKRMERDIEQYTWKESAENVNAVGPAALKASRPG